jgi:hypothetical protein
MPFIRLFRACYSVCRIIFENEHCIPFINIKRYNAPGGPSFRRALTDWNVHLVGFLYFYYDFDMSHQPAPETDLVSGPSETIAASIPKALANAVRACIGKREFSRFVTQAMRRELTRRNRESLVHDLIAEIGAPNEDEIRKIDELMR